MAAVVERAPDWNALPAATPEAVRTVLRRCLEKDPAHRLRDIRDVRLELNDALVSGPEVTAPAGLRAPVAPRCLDLGRGGCCRDWGDCLWPSLRTGVQKPGDETPRRSRHSSSPGLPLTTVCRPIPALSPDGRFVIYTSNKAGNFDLLHPACWRRQTRCRSPGTPRTTGSPTGRSTTRSSFGPSATAEACMSSHRPAATRRGSPRSARIHSGRRTAVPSCSRACLRRRDTS